MSTSPALRRLGAAELTSVLALSMALGAFGIDVLLPAFPEVRTAFGLAADSNATAGLVTTYFIGLAAGQLVLGPLSDRFGRRPLLRVSLAVYVLGALLSVASPTFATLLAARFVWGLGAAGLRAVVLAVIRDIWSGERMARQMSFVMAVFILVPIIAPTLGAVLTDLGGLAWVLASGAVAGVVIAVWSLRLPETLAEGARRSVAPRELLVAARMVVGNRQTLGYTLSMTALYAVFTSYIASSERIIGGVLGLEDEFPLVFGAMATALGAAMLLNGAIVERVGSRTMVRRVFVGYVALSAAFLVVALASGGVPSVPAFMLVVVPLLACHALLVPNLNSLALEPMGAVAGTASALSGATQVAGGALLGSALDRMFDGTITPFAIGFLCYGLLSWWLSRWAAVGDPAVPGGTTDATSAVAVAAERP